jgi:hypothetical protein
MAERRAKELEAEAAAKDSEKTENSENPEK